MSRFIRSIYPFLRQNASFMLRKKGLIYHKYFAGTVCGLCLGSYLTSHVDIVSYARGILQRQHVHAARVDESNIVPNNLNFIADVVEKVLPAVVFIERGMETRFAMFGSGSGSGFIIREDGLIVTNGHVVGNSRKVRVTLGNGEKLEGQVLAVDPVIDIALVSVPSGKLPTMSLGQSKNLRHGEWVVALGSPHFLTNSVTVGVVSAKDRDLGHAQGLRYIQTDAVITHGNSGGPLVNVHGEVVGINTMKLEAGIGFAVPADIVRRFVDNVLLHIKDKKPTESKGTLLGKLFDFSKDSSKSKSSDSTTPDVSYGGSMKRQQMYIGISMMTLNSSILSELKRLRPGYFEDVAHGVFVHSVHLNSPADIAGLKPHDVIVSIDGKKVHSSDEVYKIVNESADAKRSGTLDLSVMRGGRLVTLNVRPEYVNRGR